MFNPVHLGGQSADGPHDFRPKPKGGDNPKSVPEPASSDASLHPAKVNESQSSSETTTTEPSTGNGGGQTSKVPPPPKAPKPPAKKPVARKPQPETRSDSEPPAPAD